MNIKHFVTQGESKSNYVERVIKTLRSLMHRFMKKGAILPIYRLAADPTTHLNPPSATKRVRAKENEVDQIASQYLTLKTKKPRRNHLKKIVKKRKNSFRFKIGDSVRISHVKHAFEREFMENIRGNFSRLRGEHSSKIFLCIDCRI